MKSTKTYSLNNESNRAGENSAFVFFTIILTLLSFLVQLWLPWWSLVVVSWFWGYIMIPKEAFLIGLLSNTFVWFIKCFILDIRNESLLSGKIVELTGLHYVTVLILLTSLFAGIMGGLACISGKKIRQVYHKPESNLNPEETDID